MESLKIYILLNKADIYLIPVTGYTGHIVLPHVALAVLLTVVSKQHFR